MIITDFEEITDILDSSPRAFLYDTVAISRHELAYFRHGVSMSQSFINNDVVILTQTILDELKFSEDTGRYTNFLQQFPKIILIDETSLIDYFHEMYVPKQRALSQYKNCAIRSFQSIQSLVDSIKHIETDEIERRVMDLFLTYFSSGKNKGEYSLLWLSNMLCEIFPKISIFFIGLDRDLYNIVNHCYHRFKDIGSEIRSPYDVRVLSDELMLQALLRRGESIDSLVGCYRDEVRKVLYKEISGGITAPKTIEGAMDNPLFLERLKQGTIEVIY
ncbi:hypothetical protein [Paenibacillus sp. HW567]|uniref:hypothetical protein n=1 Tax=Paenibacillus sp. HW567 TaxID=1034769 RepID=UPI00036AF0D3|nr:hypothetical protein [Paenibacillus sp. HW567]